MVPNHNTKRTCFILLNLIFKITSFSPTSISFLPVMPRKLRVAMFKHSCPLMLTYFPILLENTEMSFEHLHIKLFFFLCTLYYSKDRREKRPAFSLMSHFFCIYYKFNFYSHRYAQTVIYMLVYLSIILFVIL